MDTHELAEAKVARALSDVKRHKKSVRYHRKALRDSMQKLRDICEAHGIKLSIIQGGGEHHGPEDTAGTDDAGAGKSLH